MAALTNRAAALSLAAGVGLVSALLSGPALAAPAKAKPAPNESVSTPSPQSVVVGKSFKFTVKNLKPKTKTTVYIPGLQKSYTCSTGGSSKAPTCTFTITVPKTAQAPASSSIDNNGIANNGSSFTVSKYIEWHAASPSSVGVCVPSSSPKVTCAPSIFGPIPQSVKVGDYTRIFYQGLKPGTTIKVYIPGFPKNEQNFYCTIDATQSCVFYISVPLNVKAPGSTSVNTYATAADGSFFGPQKTLQYHTATSKTTVGELKYLGYLGNVAPSAAKGSATGGTSLASTSAAAAASQPASGLAFTGAEIAGMSVIGVGLIGAGGIFFLGGRRRRKAPVSL